ncbi:MAG: Ryanodine receptor Ryr [Ruminiclostridium sp.]|nr:Ryanodine receptor Ryr [Ruminiclostridium sp.]
MYKPEPADTSDIVLPESLEDLAELLAENVHEVWAQNREREGWSYGESRSLSDKLTPCLVPYSELSETEKDYDRRTASETLKFIMKLGYKITKDE